MTKYIPYVFLGFAIGGLILGIFDEIYLINAPLWAIAYGVNRK